MSGNIDIARAIKAINPDAQFQYSKEDISSIKWNNGTPPISQVDIEAKQAELQAEFDSLQYQRDRKKEYPPIGDQLDYIYHNGLTKWKADMITPVKEKYPKPD